MRLKLIKELLDLSEDRGEKITSDTNLEAVKTVLKADGDIPLGGESHNQCDKLFSEDGRDLFYISLNPPHGDFEAFVVLDSKGRVSYLDSTKGTLVIDDHIIEERAASHIEDAVEQVLETYEIDGSSSSRPMKDGGILAYYKALNTH